MSTIAMPHIAGDILYRQLNPNLNAQPSASLVFTCGARLANTLSCVLQLRCNTAHPIVSAATVVV